VARRLRPGAAATAPLDRLTAAATLAAAGTLCTALAELHRHGQAHRALGPDAVLLLDRYRRAVPRDLGLAGFAPTVRRGAGHLPRARAVPDRGAARGIGPTARPGHRRPTNWPRSSTTH
jgi:hypothetical protein